MDFAVRAAPGTSLGGKNTSAEYDAQAACSRHGSSESKYSSPTIGTISSLHASGCAVETPLMARLFPDPSRRALRHRPGRHIVERPPEVAVAANDTLDPPDELLQQLGIGSIRDLPAELHHAVADPNRYLA